MRTVVNISLPPQMNDLLEEEVATGKFASKSEFVRDLIRTHMELKLAKELEKSHKELKSGKGKILKSLSELR